MSRNSSAPSIAVVIAATGGHPGNPWREQRLLGLYQAAGGLDLESTVEAALTLAAA